MSLYVCLIVALTIFSPLFLLTSDLLVLLEDRLFNSETIAPVLCSVVYSVNVNRLSPTGKQADRQHETLRFR